MSYVDAFFERDKDAIHVVERVNEKRIFRTYPTKYAFFYPDAKGKYRSIYGKPLNRVSTTSGKAFQKERKLYSHKQLYESDVNPIFRCLEEYYLGKEAPTLNKCFFDIEVDFSAQANTYNIQFENASGSMDPLDFGWASTDIYFTVRKKIFGFNIPFIAKAKLFAGGGYNTHTTTPLASEDMITDLLGGDINNDVSNLDNSLEDYLSDSDNYLTSSGYHLQGGLQFKLFLLDTFVFYRQVFVEDVIPDAKGFGSMNLRIGMGF